MKIDKKTLKEIDAHYRRFNLKFKVRGLNYERCAELPYIINKLKKKFDDSSISFLDLGSGGESPLPTYLLTKTKWKISCVDKFNWIEKQLEYAKRFCKDKDRLIDFHIIVKDFLKTDLPEESYDIITNISVIEHFEGDTDMQAMEKSGKLLKKGGLYFLTTPVNDLYYKEFYVNKNVYGEEYTTKKVFYQRHYDLEAIEKRLIKPSGLKEEERIYFGDYKTLFFEKYLQVPKWLKPFTILYLWRTPEFSLKHLSYSDKPISRKKMKVNTESGVILVFTKI